MQYRSGTYDEHGYEHAWIENAAMIIEQSHVGYDVRCSDGWGNATFDDLHVRLAAPDWELIPIAEPWLMTIETAPKTVSPPLDAAK